jgi:hypothetical protein
MLSRLEVGLSYTGGKEFLRKIEIPSKLQKNYGCFFVIFVV